MARPWIHVEVHFGGDTTNPRLTPKGSEAQSVPAVETLLAFWAQLFGRQGRSPL